MVTLIHRAKPKTNVHYSVWDHVQSIVIVNGSRDYHVHGMKLTVTIDHRMVVFNRYDMTYQ